MLPELAIVIPSHNRPGLLHHCLRTVTRHAPLRTEILVVDDGSPYGRATSVAARFDGVRILRLPRRRGFCAAVNAGIHATRSRIVELLNDDTEVTAGWAESALACFRDPKVAAAAPLVLCKGEGRADRFAKLGRSGPLTVDSAGDRYYLGGVAGKRGHCQPLGAAYLHPCRVFGASASSGFFRRDVLLQVGGFPESFQAYFEDVDLAFRLHWAGYEVIFEPASRVYHHVSASYGRPSRRLLEQQSRNEERVFWRNLPAHALIGALPRHLAVLVAKAWRRWQRGELLPFLCGRLGVLGEVATLRKHRRWLRQLGSAGSMEGWEVERSFWD
ncbi:MAG TPA: glycosyltransferase family 2 protein [Gemmataceae bacterium]|nr:glycosyltransferase family 2 protein [Gemmataceae bacterium]